MRGVYIDGTFGAGGHTRAILGVAGTRVIGIDRDREAIAGGFALVEQAEGRLTLVEDRFSNLEHVARSLGHDAVDGVLLDLGVSSMQLDQAGRGFSFRNDGPLDMRMGGEGPSAADLVNAASERDLVTSSSRRSARSASRAMSRARSCRRAPNKPITTTGALAEIVSRVVRGKPGEVHPATRTFQALRMFVNDELGELVAALDAAERMLKAGGRLAVISFHSLEDRIVKTFLAERGRIVARLAPPAGSRARAAELRDPDAQAAGRRTIRRSPPIRARAPPSCAPAQRTAAAPIGGDLSHLLPRLPSLADVMRGR